MTATMSRPPRLAGFDYLGPHRYFLTFCTFRRHRTFTDSNMASLVIAQFRRTVRESAFELLAYCVMPDHVHLLVEGTSVDSNLIRCVKRLKQRSGQIYSQLTRRRLWQEGYYDRILRPSDDARAIARYIAANPIRAGLAVGPRDYPHIGSDIWTVDELIQ